MTFRAPITLLSATLVAACTESPTTPAAPAAPQALIASADDAAAAALGQRLAYVRADQPTNPLPYAANPVFSFNLKGGANTIASTGNGSYKVTFGGMAKGGVPNRRETLLVTPVGPGTGRCAARSWTDVGPDLEVLVTCVDIAQHGQSREFDLLLLGQNTLPGRLGFAKADQPLAPRYTPDPSYSYARTTVPISIGRSGAGDYTVDVHMPRRFGGHPESWFVSAVGAVLICQLDSFGKAGEVDCYAGNGASTDATYDAVQIEQGRPGKRFGFTFAHLPTVPSYSGDPFWTTNSSGQGVNITRVSKGTYDVTFQGLRKFRGETETVQLTAVGPSVAATCVAQSWVAGLLTDLRVRVACHSRLGTSLDTQFTILVLE